MSLRSQERGLFTVQGLIFSLGLVASFVSVGAVYAGMIRPAIARSSLATSVGLLDEAALPPLFVLLNGYEQQVCLSLFLWALMILAYKAYNLRYEATALRHFLPKEEGGGSEPHFELFSAKHDLDRAEAGDYARTIETRSREHTLQNKILPYVLTRGLERYHLTGNAQEVTETISGRLDVAAEQQESELSVLRYIAWAIPSIGFIGTVRGIGIALQRADEALEGDISGVTSALGLAFNSTLIALILSIALVLFIHLLAANQEGLIIRVETFCRERLIDRLRDRSGEASPPPLSPPAQAQRVRDPAAGTPETDNPRPEASKSAADRKPAPNEA